jgi:hypothetical protein
MLSITHHTRKRPSTSPRTTHGPRVALWGVPVDGVVVTLCNLASSSSSPTSMVSTSELTVVVSTDTVGPVLFCFFLLASAD